jgi:hypothetical protein
MMSPKRAGRTSRVWRRVVLVALVLAVVAAPALSSGCVTGFDPISKVDALRVLAVVADKPYAAPGDTVHFSMTYYDGYAGGPRPVQVLWVGGCFDPVEDEYYACYPEFAALFQQGGVEQAIASGLIGMGDTFSLTLPENIVSQRPVPASGPHYGIAYVFFTACAGTVGPVAADGSGEAGSFPLGCFDSAGNQLDQSSFVPGFTQVYSFAEGWTTPNPELDDVTISGTSIPFAPGEEPADGGTGAADGGSGSPDGGTASVPTCGISEEQRKEMGCSKSSTTCQEYTIDVVVPDDVAPIDPEGSTVSGQPIHAVVWVDYFASAGDFDDDIKLVSDATTGITSSHSSNWTPPPTTGPVLIWAVLHDSLGGQTVTERQIMVQ